MNKIKIFPEIPELEFLLENSRDCFGGHDMCRRCNSTKGYAEFLGCENYKEIGEK